MVIKYDEKSCGIVLCREKDGTNLYLILHYPGGHWDLPKGHIESGENEHQTAARELLEETGVADFTFVDGFREEISYKYKKDKKMSNKQVIFFLAKTDLEEIKLSHEHHAFKWLPFGPAFNKLTFENAKNILKSKNFWENKNLCYNPIMKININKKISLKKGLLVILFYSAEGELSKVPAWRDTLSTAVKISWPQR